MRGGYTEYGGDVGEYDGDVGEYDGDVGEYDGDVGNTKVGECDGECDDAEPSVSAPMRASSAVCSGNSSS